MRLLRPDTYEAWRKPRDRVTGDGIGSGKAAGEDGQEEKGNQMSKDEGGRNSSLSEKPVRSQPRRLVDWINLTGAKKVHSLIDKMYKRKNLEMAGERVKASRLFWTTGTRSLGMLGFVLPENDLVFGGLSVGRLRRERQILLHVQHGTSIALQLAPD